MKNVCRFNEIGIDEVRQKIEALRKSENTFKGSHGTPITLDQMKELKALAHKPSLITSLDLNCTIDLDLKFPNRLELGKYLNTILSSQTHENDDNLWTWLSIAYIEQLLAPRKDGTYLLGSEYRYIPNNNRLRYHRHLVRMAWKIYSQYSDDAIIFLSVKPYTHSDFVEQSQKTSFLNNPNIAKTCRTLFFDEKKKKLKKGVAANKNTAPGSMRRLVGVVFEQLEMNYDLYETEPHKIIDLLPSDFEVTHI